MVKKLIFIFFIVIFGLNAKAQSDDIFHKKYSVQELKNDVEVLKRVLLNYHPSINYYASYEWYKNYFDTALNIDKDYTEKAFRILIKSKLKSLHCGHTNVFPSKKYRQALKKTSFVSIPYYMAYYPPYLINIRSFSKKDSLLHYSDSILMLNETSVENYAHFFEKLLYVDGKAEVSVQELLQKNLLFYYSGYEDQDSVLVSLKKYGGIKNFYIKTRSYKYLNNELWHMKSDTLSRKFGKKYFTGIFLDKHKKIYYMKIKSFSGIHMKHFFRKSFRALKHYQSEVLIMDLRNNPGGKITQCTNLLSYLLPQTDSLFYQTRIKHFRDRKHLKKKLEFQIIRLFMQLNKNKKDSIYIEQIKKNKKYHFDGKIYVIVNCNTFSAANLITVYLSNKNRHTSIVGTEPSGVIWGSNAVSFLKLILPHTKIQVLIPTYRIYHNIKNIEKDSLQYPIKPNVYNDYQPSDYLLKKDKALESIYFDLKNNL